MPGEPDVLYISELQADPLQAKKIEFTGPGGEEIKTRQLTLPGARRYDDTFRKFQVENAGRYGDQLFDLQQNLSGFRSDLLNLTPTSQATGTRINAVQNLLKEVREINQTAGKNYDFAMQDQMEEHGRIYGFREVRGGYSPKSIPMFGTGSRNMDLEAIQDKLESLRNDLMNIQNYYGHADRDWETLG